MKIFLFERSKIVNTINYYIFFDEIKFGTNEAETKKNSRTIVKYCVIPDSAIKLALMEKIFSDLA